MPVRYYDIEINGTQPLLMHHDNIEWADRMDAWKSNKDNKKKSKAGDDRTPPYRWIGYLYKDYDNRCVVIPTENIMRSMMEGGSMVPVPGGKSGKTFKSQSQSGIIPMDSAWQLLVNGSNIPIGPIEDLIGVEEFEKHMEAVERMGFKLFVKRARIGQQKHIRVRPMFISWAVRGIMLVQDEQITDDILREILLCAGTYKGLGDWRPGSKTPGTFGTFEAIVTPDGVVKNDSSKRS